MGHHFFVIRAIGGADGPSQQDRLCADYFDTVEDWDV
jgi:hypothetical protein